MLTLTFDTLDFANRLKAGNVPDEQAQAQAHALNRVLEERDRALAALEQKIETRQALARHEAERAATKGDLAEVRGELKEDIAHLRGDIKLLKWMMGTLIAASLSLIVGVLSLVIKAFF